MTLADKQGDGLVVLPRVCGNDPGEGAVSKTTLEVCLPAAVCRIIIPWGAAQRGAA